jgi:signal recognition particle receptor subunit beta
VVLVDLQQRELTIKLVYYGPALSGKTTNLRRLHERVAAATGRGQLMSLDTYADRTLFFDLLGIVFRASGMSVRIRLYTVPGQVIHDATRRLVLQGADGVAFVADSRIAETRLNQASFENLKQNLRENGVDPARVPLVIQFNKRDLDGIRPDAELDRLAAAGRDPIYKASALRGEGVLETFLGLAERTWRSLEAQHGFEQRIGISPPDFLRELHAQFGNP